MWLTGLALSATCGAAYGALIASSLEGLLAGGFIGAAVGALLSASVDALGCAWVAVFGGSSLRTRTRRASFGVAVGIAVFMLGALATLGLAAGPTVALWLPAAAGLIVATLLVLHPT